MIRNVIRNVWKWMLFRIFFAYSFVLFRIVELQFVLFRIVKLQFVLFRILIKHFVSFRIVHYISYFISYSKRNDTKWYELIRNRSPVGIPDVRNMYGWIALTVWLAVFRVFMRFKLKKNNDYAQSLSSTGTLRTQAIIEISRMWARHGGIPWSPFPAPNDRPFGDTHYFRQLRRLNGQWLVIIMVRPPDLRPRYLTILQNGYSFPRVDSGWFRASDC